LPPTSLEFYKFV